MLTQTLLLATALLYGTVDIGSETYPTLSLNGSARLEGTTVEDKLTVNGDLRANKTSLGSAVIHGSGIIDHSTVRGDLSVQGTIDVKNSQLRSAHIQGTTKLRNTAVSHHLAVTGEKVSLVNSTVQSLLVRALDGSQKDGEQVVKLKGSTEIQGDITFEGGHGIIVLGPRAKIHGKIHGGTVHQATF